MRQRHLPLPSFAIYVLLHPQQRSQQIMTQQGQQPGYDRVRATDIGLKDYELKHLDEAFTSEHWIGAPA